MTGEAWEYRREQVGGLFRSFNLDRMIDDLLRRCGAEGWELVSERQSWLSGRFYFVFKRRRVA